MVRDNKQILLYHDTLNSLEYVTFSVLLFSINCLYNFRLSDDGRLFLSYYFWTLSNIFKFQTEFIFNHSLLLFFLDIITRWLFSTVQWHPILFWHIKIIVIWLKNFDIAWFWRRVLRKVYYRNDRLVQILFFFPTYINSACLLIWKFPSNCYR